MWYIVLSRSKPEMEDDKQNHYDEHRLWLEEQHKNGRLLFSGPTSDGAYGIYIMLAGSLDAVLQVHAHHHGLLPGRAAPLTLSRRDRRVCRPRTAVGASHPPP